MKDNKTVKSTMFNDDGMKNLEIEYDDYENVIKLTQFNYDETKNHEIEYGDNGNAINETKFGEDVNIHEIYDENDEVVSRTFDYPNGIPIYYGTNGSAVARFLNNARDTLIDYSGSEEFNRVVEETFGDNLVYINTIRDGSLDITLKDCSKIYMDYSLGVDYGSPTITKPDGTVEKYSSDGEKIE